MRAFIVAWLSLAAALAAAFDVRSAEFRSVGGNAAVLYDAPSTKAKKMYVIGRDYPLEVVVVVEGWIKVKDPSGELTWIEARNLAANRTVVVRARVAEVRAAAADNSPLAFQVEQNVILNLLEPASAGWARVAHRDGQSGYIRANQVWGL